MCILMTPAVTMKRVVDEKFRFHETQRLHRRVKKKKNQYVACKFEAMHLEINNLNNSEILFKKGVFVTAYNVEKNGD
jgi:hypothetical protein